MNQTDVTNQSSERNTNQYETTHTSQHMSTETTGAAPSGALEGTIPPSDPAYPAGWSERVGAFATATGKPLDDITKALTGLVGDPGPDSLSILADPSAITDEDLRLALVAAGPQIPLGVFRKHLTKLRGAPSMATTSTDGSTTGSYSPLPPVPDDTSFLEMLKVGGVLKVGPTEVISAVKTAIASRFGLYDLPVVIQQAMERFAYSQDEPVGEEYFEVQNLITTRNYGEILSALGVKGSFISTARRREFLRRVDEFLWPALVSFHGQLVSWQEAWMAGMANPGMLMAALAMNRTGAAGAAMPPGMMQPPETAGIRDAAETVVNQINKTFAGVGRPVARAMAYDATRIKGILENDKLPALIGASTREQMLKQLGVTVTSDYIRMERNIAGYTLAVMELPKITAGNEELAYLSALIQLGLSIPWDKVPGRSKIGSDVGSHDGVDDDIEVGGERIQRLTSGLGRSKGRL